MTRTLALLLALALAPTAGAPAAAQDFAPVIRVDDAIITAWELDQRVQFLTLLGVPGDVAREAEATLIDDRLRLLAAHRLGAALTRAAVRAGMEEFAARAQLSADEMIAILGEAGVAEATFRDFVEAGLIWREMVRQRFLPRLQQVSDADIDRALAAGAERGAFERVLISELVLPAGRDAEAARLAQALRDEAAFAAAARERSRAATAAEGGRIDWTPLGFLPPQIAAAVAPLQLGQISAPVQTAEGVAIFLLRGREAVERPSPRVTMVEYATLTVPDAAAAAALRATATRCGDLWGLTPGGPDRVAIERRLLSAVPAAIAAQLARLDPSEMTLRPGPGGAGVQVLMLCERRLASGLPPSREAVRERLIVERLEGHARIWLAELRAAADIRR